MHMCYYLMKNSELMEVLKMNHLDKLAMLISASCHDLGHDGFTNSYHTNTITERAINSNDVSIQETFHASELFRILTNKKTNFLDGLSRIELLHFRKRSIQLILATDMSHHNSKLSMVKSLIQLHKFTDSTQILNWIEDGGESAKGGDQQYNLKIFTNQQIIMDIIIHTADVSQ